LRESGEKGLREKEEIEEERNWDWNGTEDRY
jgi:hypothetical protein